MQVTKYIWQNGDYVNFNDAKVHVLSHTLHYGGGAFEGIRVYKTDKGPAVYCLIEHVERLLYSAKSIGMKVNYTVKQVCDIVLNLIRKNNITAGYVRPLFYYGYKSLGINALDNPVEFIVACWPWENYLKHTAVDVKTSKYVRIHPGSTITDAKISGNYINSQLAAIEIHGTKYHEALLLDYHGYVAEGAAENIFVIKNNKIYTPKTGNILPGITRQTIINLSKHYGYELEETQLVLDDIYNCDEAFFTGTAAEVTAIRSLDDKILGTGKPGDITCFIKEKYHQLVTGYLSDFASSLTYVDNI